MFNFRCSFQWLRRPSVRGRYAVINVVAGGEIHRLLNGCPLMSRKHIRVLPRAVNRLVELLNVKPRGWDLRFEVVLFLFWLACGGSFRVVSVAFNVPRSTCHMICTYILDKVIALLPRIICLPENEGEFARMGDGFSVRSGSRVFENSAGAIDGTHLRVLCPSQLHDQYICRKLFYSIQLQAVCDHTGAFIDIMTGFPGSVNDKRVLRYSMLYRNAQYANNNAIMQCSNAAMHSIHPKANIC
jgi:hypothetical protein